jgi:hypothetical protein
MSEPLDVRATNACKLTLKEAVRAKAQPTASLLAEIDYLRAQLAEAQESYRGANQRICELIGAKIVLTKQRDELAAALEKYGRHRNGCAIIACCPCSCGFETLDPASILAGRERRLSKALNALVQVIFEAQQRNPEASAEFVNEVADPNAFFDAWRMAREALAAAPEAKP